MSVFPYFNRKKSTFLRAGFARLLEIAGKVSLFVPCGRVADSRGISQTKSVGGNAVSTIMIFSGRSTKKNEYAINERLNVRIEG
jgi:hypothetical protein